MILNITSEGVSVDFEVEDVTELSDQDVHVIAETLTGKTFPNYVIDRFGNTVYLRPKVPFGAFV